MAVAVGGPGCNIFDEHGADDRTVFARGIGDKEVRGPARSNGAFALAEARKEPDEVPVRDVVRGAINHPNTNTMRVLAGVLLDGSRVHHVAPLPNPCEPSPSRTRSGAGVAKRQECRTPSRDPSRSAASRQAGSYNSTSAEKRLRTSEPAHLPHPPPVPPIAGSSGVRCRVSAAVAPVGDTDLQGTGDRRHEDQTGVRGRMVPRPSVRATMMPLGASSCAPSAPPAREGISGESSAHPPGRPTGHEHPALGTGVLGRGFMVCGLRPPGVRAALRQVGSA